MWTSSVWSPVTLQAHILKILRWICFTEGRLRLYPVFLLPSRRPWHLDKHARGIASLRSDLQFSLQHSGCPFCSPTINVVQSWLGLHFIPIRTWISCKVFLVVQLEVAFHTNVFPCFDEGSKETVFPQQSSSNCISQALKSVQHDASILWLFLQNIAQTAYVNATASSPFSRLAKILQSLSWKIAISARDSSGSALYLVCWFNQTVWGGWEGSHQGWETYKVGFCSLWSARSIVFTAS